MPFQFNFLGYVIFLEKFFHCLCNPRNYKVQQLIHGSVLLGLVQRLVEAIDFLFDLSGSTQVCPSTFSSESM